MEAAILASTKMKADDAESKEVASNMVESTMKVATTPAREPVVMFIFILMMRCLSFDEKFLVEFQGTVKHLMMMIRDLCKEHSLRFFLVQYHSSVMSPANLMIMMMLQSYMTSVCYC